MQTPSPSPPLNTSGQNFSSDDAALIAGVLRKDRKATAEFVSKYSDCVYRYVRLRLSPRLDMVDDSVQEVFLAAWQNLESYRGTSTLQAWLLGIARHKIEDYYRGVLRQAESLNEVDREELRSNADLELEEALDRKYLQERTQKILARLPQDYSVVLLWRYWEQRPVREMAQETGRTEKAIEHLLSRARAKFREMWNHE